MFSEDMKPLKKVDEAEGEKMETDWTNKTTQSLGKKRNELKKF
jgi:predicted DNA-binding antitoxin AbrB/MazE fold protein